MRACVALAHEAARLAAANTARVGQPQSHSDETDGLRWGRTTGLEHVTVTMGTRAMNARAKKAMTTTKPNFVVGFVYLLGTTTTTTTTTTTHAMVWLTVAPNARE